ncbi:MAG: fructose-bisphosphate aldolase class I, partial [Gammaproteobacteria bacterium]|nr:fructose-bisphosphate aldolase class I [Gammaproteobacteria bacterium]
MNVKQLNSVARAMVGPGKGILAADESSPTIKKRFDQINTESTEENRRLYRQMLFTTPGAEQYIGGVILFEETLGQSTDGNVPFPKLLARKGMIPGIKVDKGAKALAGLPGETVTEGLDGLRDRLAAYREQGAQFAKWRAVIDIDEASGVPSRFAIEANAHALARYAALCQEADIVPIVEPEVLMDGAHSIHVCQRVTEEVLIEVYRQLALHRVALEGTLLKPNMVIAGKKCPQQA